MNAHASRPAAAVDLARLTTDLGRRHPAFAAATPFPHVVIDDFLEPATAAAMAEEFDPASPHWVFLHHVNERKLILNDIGAMGPVSQAVVAALHSGTFVHALETLTGIDGLLADPTLDGGGLALTRPGGFLNVHADFLAHSKHRTWSRQVNLILFLSPGWREDYRGWLELWDANVSRCERRILPAFNRCVIFRTSTTSFHGVPAGVASPETLPRRSLALYFFRDEGRTCQLRPTRYVPLPTDGPLRRVAIGADRLLIQAYSYLKRYTPLGDRLVSRLLKHL